MKKWIWATCVAVALAACEKTKIEEPEPPELPQQQPEYDESLVLGADLSLLPLYEQSVAVYRDSAGNKVAPLDFFEQEGVNCVRVRLFVDPQNNETAARQDLDYVATFAKRIKAKGLQFMLDIHYSDTWADPGTQNKPAAWADLSFNELNQQVYGYTHHVLDSLNHEGATPDYIQTGNEITGGMLWPDGNRSENLEQFCTLLKSAGKACRELCPNAKIVLHIERPQWTENVVSFYTQMASDNIDYDIIGLSYYPHWHNNIASLATTLKQLENKFSEKEIMIVEYGYYNNWYPDDATFDFTNKYPASAEGQAAMTRDLITELVKHKQVTGFFYWFPEENEAQWTKILDGWTNRGLFSNQNGRALPALYELKKFRLKQ